MDPVIGCPIRPGVTIHRQSGPEALPSVVGLCALLAGNIILGELAHPITELLKPVDRGLLDEPLLIRAHIDQSHRTARR